MGQLHVVLVISLIFGILLQPLLQLISFQWATLLFVLLNLTLPFYLVRKLTKFPLRPMPLGPISFKTGLSLGILILCTFPAIQIIGQFASLFVDNPLKDQALTLSFPLFLSVVVIAPVIEELFFRGYLLEAYEDQNIAFAIFWTALWFGLYHLNMHQSLYTFFFALLLGGLMKYYNNIAVPIMVHSGVNALSYFSGSSRHGDVMTMTYQLLSPAGWSVGFRVLYLLGFMLCAYLLYFKSTVKSRSQGRKPFQMDRSTWVIVAVFVWTAFLTYL